MVQIRVLGPLELRVAGRVCDLAGPRQRAVLARLLMAGGGVVPVDRLIDDIWRGTPPRQAIGTLQAYVSNLRRLLEPDRAPRAPAQRLLSVPPGYCLRLPAVAVDAWRFEELVRQGQAAQDPQTVHRTLETALALWQGPAYAELADESWAATEAARLDDLRLDARELLIGSGVQLGAGARMVAPAEGLTREHPLREEGWRLLALALHSCGRQAEAHAALRRVRAVLDEELGVGPGPALLELEARLQDPRPEGPRSPIVPPAHPVVRPAQLPVDLSAFSGREEEVERIVDQVIAADDASRTVLITAIGGMAGIGKTALAVHCAHRLVQNFPDGQLYVNLRGFDPSGSVIHPIEAIRGFLEAFGVPADRIPLSADAQAALYRSLLAERRVLVVIDNARDAEQVRALLPGGPGCMALVTSRTSLIDLVTHEGALALSLRLLPDSQAQELLVRRIGAERVVAERQAVADIIQLCGGLPLALAIVAARAATHPGFALAEISAELQLWRSSLDGFSFADTSRDVRGVFSWSYDVLGPDAARLLRFLSLLPGSGFDQPAAASAGALTARRARAVLTELTSANLLSEYAAGRYRFHDLLRTYSRELLQEKDSAADRQDGAVRVLDHYLYPALSAMALLNPYRDPSIAVLSGPAPGTSAPPALADHQAALAWFTRHHDALLAAVELAVSVAADTHVWRLAWAMESFLLRRGFWRDGEATQRLALAATRRLRDRRAEARVEHSLGQIYSPRALDRPERSYQHYAEALALFAECGDLVNEAHTRLRMAEVMGRAARHEEEHDHLVQALKLYQTLEAGGREVEILDYLAEVYYRLGQPQRTLDCLRRCLVLLRSGGDRHREANAWMSLGTVQTDLGQFTDAITALTRSAGMYRDIGDHFKEADTLVELAAAQIRGGDRQAAITPLEQAHHIFTRLGSPRAEAVREQLTELGSARAGTSAGAPAGASGPGPSEVQVISKGSGQG
jgi:DNA-binding SARP family transcriptional activator/tetratricopeptide (TPR) repeat protein